MFWLPCPDTVSMGQHLYLVKPTMGPPKKFQHLARAEDVVITRLRIGQTKASKVPYLVPRTADCLSPLWSNIEHWPNAPGVSSVTGMSWRILQSWLIEYSLRENSRDLHNGISARSGILLSDMMQFVYFNWTPDLDNIMGLGVVYLEKWEQFWDTSTCVQRLICPGARVVLKQIQSNTTVQYAVEYIWWSCVSDVIMYLTQTKP